MQSKESTLKVADSVIFVLIIIICSGILVDCSKLLLTPLSDVCQILLGGNVEVIHMPYLALAPDSTLSRWRSRLDGLLTGVTRSKCHDNGVVIKTCAAKHAN